MYIGFEALHGEVHVSIFGLRQHHVCIYLLGKLCSWAKNQLRTHSAVVKFIIRIPLNPLKLKK